MDSMNWDDFVCDSEMLNQDEFEKMLQDTNRFAPMEGYEPQPIDMGGSASQGGNSVQPAELTTDGYASLLVDQFLTPEQLNALSAPANATPYFSLEDIDQLINQPMDMTDYSQQNQTFPEGGDIFDDCFGAVQFTSPMAQDLNQIATEPSSHQNTFGGIPQENIFQGSAFDPNMFSSVVDSAYVYNYPTETFADQGPLYQAQQNFKIEDSASLEGLFDAPPFVPQVAPLPPLEENPNLQFDDSELLGDLNDVIVVSTPRQLFLPAPAVAPTRPRTSRKTLPAPATEAGPSTPTRADRKPLVEVSPLKCAGQIKVVNEVRRPSGRAVKVPYQYTVYKPLRPWGRIRYNARGYLHEAIRFNAEEMNDFISSKFAPCSNISD